MRKLISSLTVLLSISLAMALNPGDLVITEIMQNPLAVSDANGEWFEVYNATGAAIDLLDLIVTEDGGGNTFVIGSSVNVNPGSYALLARNGDPLINGGLPPVDYVYPGTYYLGNSADEIFIIEVVGIDTTVIDEVWYDNGVTFPDPNGASMVLSDLELDNNIGANWYEETVYTYGSGDYGTPGAPNVQVGYPIISDVTQLPAAPGSSDEVDISATVTDPDVRTVVNVDLIYDVDGGPESTLAMTAAGDIYSATIPAQAGSSTVTWRIEATDDLDQTSFYGPIVYVVVDIPTYSIYDIQYTTDPSGDSPYNTQMVSVTGTVTAIGISGDGSFFLQDAETAWSGIQIYGNNTGIALHDNVTVIGVVEEYFNQTELHIYGPEAFVINFSGDTPIAPILLSIGDAYTEPYESVVVRVEGGTCSSLPDGYGVWLITDGVNTGEIDDWFVPYTPVLDQCYDIQGLMYYSYETFAINPRDLTEIGPCGGGNLPPSITNIGHLPTLPTSIDLVTVSATVTDDVGVDHVDLLYIVDGGGAITVAMTAVNDLFSADIPAQIDGSLVEYYIEATDTPDLEMATSDTYSYIVIDEYTCIDIALVRANDAEGQPLMEGEAVMICGVLSVAHEFGASGPAYLTHATGSVAFHGGVFADDTQLVIGDEVEVVGLVGAYNGLTQIQDPPVVNFIQHAGAPTPVTVTLADLNLDSEAYEAQLLLVEGVTLIDPENWPLEGDYANLLVEQGVDTFAVYIDRDTNIDGSTAPTEPFDLIGVMSQYDNSLPWTVGYNISPRMLDDVGLGVAPPVVTIYDIQYTTEPSGDSPYINQEVTTSGIVYALFTSGFFMQDAAGAWSGIQVYGANDGVVIGDEVTVTGTVVEYYNLTELTIATAADYTILSSGNPLFGVTLGTIPVLSVEDYESVFVQVANVTCSNPDLGYGEWEVTDGTNLLIINDLMYAHVPLLDDCFETIQGALNFGFGSFRIEPREAGDIVSCATLDAPVVTITYVGGNAQLSWNPIIDATDYRVYISSEPFGGWDAGTLTGGATTFSFASAGRVFFQVVAIN
ncbi:MAG: lamin tail domain-containing protein [Candidatus Delongbacteria bacterium]|nr:lamin tail domain-containing protein [Candidatus Delongbacteria bacterium]